jgi:hypothetical protein
VFVTYGLGMGLVIAILTVAVALAKSGIVHRFRALLPVMNRIAGGLLLVAGAYVAYYGWYEIRVLDGVTSDPIVDRAIRIQTWLQNTIVPDDPWRFAAIAGAVLAGTVLVSRLIRHRSDMMISHTIIDSDEAATAVGFRGSPTFHIDGVDPFGDPAAPVGLSCRLYTTADGYAGSPTLDQLRDAVRTARDA